MRCLKEIGHQTAKLEREGAQMLYVGRSCRYVTKGLGILNHSSIENISYVGEPSLLLHILISTRNFGTVARVYLKNFD